MRQRELMTSLLFWSGRTVYQEFSKGEELVFVEDDPKHKTLNYGDDRKIYNTKLFSYTLEMRLITTSDL